MKHCPRCNEDKDESEFGKNKARYDGLQEYCRDCKRAIDREHYKNSPKRKMSVSKRRDTTIESNRRFINIVKGSCRCVSCGEDEVCTLDLHHVDPTKKEYAIAKLVSYQTKRLMDEMSKCVVLCSNCHRKVHAGKIKLNPNTPNVLVAFGLKALVECKNNRGIA